jgi:flavodoxin I
MHPVSIAVIFGSTTGNTEAAAELIRDELGDQISLFADVNEIEPDTLLQYDVLILGCPTWHIGELQDDWEMFLPSMRGMDFSGKKIAMFGMGDALSYSDTFLDAFGLLWDEIKHQGSPQLIGVWPSKGYDFDESKGMFDADHFLGLGLDEENQAEMHEDRVKEWTQQLLSELGMSPDT